MATIIRTKTGGLDALGGMTTKHCASGAMMRHYAWNGFKVEEECLLGLGEGVGFIYWHAKGAPPMLGGRASPEEGMEMLAAARTGVRLSQTTTSSGAKAEAALADALRAGESVMLQADMGFLPYFDFSGGGYHFGGHVVLACGLDEARGTFLVADRDEGLHQVSCQALADARGSTWKPFPPRNRSWKGDFSGCKEPDPEDFAEAMRRMSERMLEPPIANMGCAGIEKAARLIPGWPKSLDQEGLKAAFFNLYIFASAVGGSGGGNFRHMMARFAAIAADRCAADAATRAVAAAYADSAGLFHQAALDWDEAASLAKGLSESGAEVAAAGAADLAAIVARIAATERRAWGICAVH